MPGGGLDLDIAADAIRQPGLDDRDQNGRPGQHPARHGEQDDHEQNGDRSDQSGTSQS